MSEYDLSGLADFDLLEMLKQLKAHTPDDDKEFIDAILRELGRRQEETGSDAKKIARLVAQVDSGSIPPFIARSQIERLGYVLREGSPFTFAVSALVEECGACKHWEHTGFHMGIYDGVCLLINEPIDDVGTCDKWESAVGERV